MPLCGRKTEIQRAPIGIAREGAARSGAIEDVLRYPGHGPV